MQIKDRYSIDDLLDVMQRLRDPENGCPWDLEQTPNSLTRYTIEECYELVDAIESGDSQHISEELGDVLLQVVFYCQFGREQNEFDFAAVVSTLTEKLIRRHPHVFGDDVDCVDSQSVVNNWEAIKQQERNAKNQQRLFDDVPKALPALIYAHKIQSRAAKVNFDFSDTQQVLVQLKSELTELEEAINSAEKLAIDDEMGDVLFSCVNLARHLKVHAEDSLRQSSSKFMRRLHKVEAYLQNANKDWQDLSAAQRDELWKQAKAG